LSKNEIMLRPPRVQDSQPCAKKARDLVHVLDPSGQTHDVVLSDVDVGHASWGAVVVVQEVVSLTGPAEGEDVDEVISRSKDV
jgi:hypothetical protein